MGGNSINICLVSVLIALAVLWKPAIAEDKCSVGCRGSSSTPTFLNGHKYTYAVEGTVSVFLSGADNQETSVRLLGQVAVSALGNCAHVLKVQNLVISGPDGKKYAKPNGLDKPVRFVLQDGLTTAEICAEDGDTRRSLNIKRAIISLLQSGLKSGNEVDIFGVCPTEASSSNEGAAVLLHRSRDLSRCAHREHGSNDLITSVYDPQAEIRSTHILQSVLNVESKLNNGVPEKVSASEEHLYKPFSVGENGARAKVATKLTLTGQAAGADNGNFNQVRSIIFENPHGEKIDSSNLNAALAAVKDTAKTLVNEASTKSAGLFAQLVRIFRSTSKDDLLNVYGQVKGNSLQKRVFLDGLLRAGTSNSIEASVQILKNKELSPLEEKLVYISLGNARHINDEALKVVATILDIPHIPKDLYIGVGALAGAYCRSHDCHSTKSEGITAVTQKFAAKLGNCKPKGKVEEDNVVAILKGIRNIKHLADNIIDKLVHCANDNGVRARVRVAALEAFQADPCTSKLKNVGLNLMKNRQLDSEIRIKAYLSVIACPCARSANEIKTLLDSEPVHQVGRFITSSLRHIKASTNPDKKLARQHYGLIGTPMKFNIDDRKYSFYREGSFNIDALGLGGNVEQTVIYSQDSFIPRSATLNVTAEVFGQNLNIFEVGGRQGNLDRVIEHFLGPQSILRTEDPQKLYDDLVKRFKDTENTVTRHISKRSVKSEIDNFDKHVKGEVAPYDNELDLDLYVKLFGSDALFLSLGDDKAFDFNRILDQLLKQVDAGINKAKKFQQQVQAHVLFLDAEIAYATSTGFPLKLNLVGSATGRLDVSTNIDIRQILKDPANAKVDIKLIPSTDVEISGFFLVDADAVTTGLKVVTNLHSSTGGHLIAKVLENGQGFDLQFGLPIEKQEIVTASNDLVYFTTEKGQPEKEIALKIESDRKEYSACFDQLSGILGLTFCAEMSVPFTVSGPEAKASVQKFLARYPLTGSSKVKVYLEKNDLRGYHVKGVFRTDQRTRRSFELLFEVEGAKNRRTSLTGELVNTPEEKGISLALESPLKVLSGQASFVNKAHELGLVIQGKLDTDEYYGRAGFTVQGNNARKVYTPKLEYQMPGTNGKKSMKVDGQVVSEVNGPVTRYTMNGIKVSMPRSPNAEAGPNDVVSINGNVGIEAGGFDVEIKAVKDELNVHLTAAVKDHNAKIEFTNTLNPIANFKINAHSDIDTAKGNVRNDIELFYSGDLKEPRNSVVLNQLLKYRTQTTSNEHFEFITKNKLAVNNLPFVVKFDAEVDSKKVDVEVEGQYVDKKIDFDLEARREIKNPGDYLLKVAANVDKNGFEAFSKRDIVNADKSNCENYVVVKGVGKYELSGVVLHRTKPNDVNVGVIGHLKISGGGKNEDFKFDIGAIENEKLYSSHAKISHAKADLLDYQLQIQRGNNPSGTLKAILKNTVSANGQFKVLDADGKGNGMFIVDFKQSNKKIKGELNFLSKNPVYNADIDLFLNFEKDNKDKIHFSTKSKLTDTHVESKNTFDYAGKKYEFNYNRNGVFERNGKGNAAAEVVLPNGRCLSAKVNREGSVKDNVINGLAEITLADQESRGGAGSSVNYKFKVINTNFEKESVSYEGQLLVKLKDGKNLQNSFYFKDLPEGDNFKIDFKSELTGNMLPQPASLSAIIEYSDPDNGIIDGHDKYRIKGNYGSDLGIEIVGNSETNLLGSGDKKWLEDNTITLRLPFEKAHDIKIVSNVLFLLPQNNQVSAEYTVVNSVQVNSDLYKVDLSGKCGQTEGFGKIKVLVPHVDPFSMDVNYKAQTKGEKKSGNVEIKSTYGKGKSASLQVAGTSQEREHSLVVKAHAPQAEKLKKLEFNVLTKNPTSDSYSSAITVDADGRVYKSDVQLVYSKAHPLIDLKYSSPSTEKTSRIFVKGNSLSSSQGRVELKVENIKDYSLAATAEGSLKKDAVAIKMTADSAKLNLKDYSVVIASKDVGSGKRIEFTAVNDGKNVLSGSTSFISKQEGAKTIIEGSGSVKVKEEEKSATFKYIRTLLTEGSEQGVETFMNVAIGDRSYVAESRVTNMEYKTSYVYCEEKKQCAHAELHSKLQVTKPGTLVHTVNVGADLRKLGLRPEFGLQYSGEISENLPKYTLDVHMNKDDDKYHMHAYSKPEFGHLTSGMTVTLPHRILSLENEIKYPTNKVMPFPLTADMVLYTDKKRPGHKSALRLLVDVTGEEKSHNVVTEFGFMHPKLGKEATVKFNGKFQYPDNNLKVESALIISHPPSLGADRKCRYLMEASTEHFKLFVETPIVKVIDLEANSIMKDNLQQGEVKFSLLGGKPVLVKAVAKDFQYFEFTTGYSDEAQRKLSIVGTIDPEKRVDVTADIILPDGKKNIVHGGLYLQDNLVKSDYGASKDNFNYFVNAFKHDLSALKDRVQQLRDDSSSDCRNIMKNVEPTLQQVHKYNVAELEALLKELADDQALKEISRGLQDILKFALKMIDEVENVIKPIIEKFSKDSKDYADAVFNMYDQKIRPQLQELCKNLGAFFEAYLNSVIDIVAHFGAIVTNFFEKHKAELQELTNTITEIFKDLTRLIVAQLKEIRVNFTNFFQNLVEQIKELPIIAEIKERIKDFAIPDQILNVFSEAGKSIRDVMPTDETKALADQINNYVQKKLHNEKVNDLTELRAIYSKFALALTSLLQVIRQQVFQYGTPYLSNLNTTPLLTSSTPSFLNLGGVPGVSIVNQLLRGDLPDPLALIKAYRPRSFNPLDEVPAKLRAVVINGQHIFTFDGAHLTFPGTCRYVLAHDFVDRNFTLVIQLANGNPKALILEDKSGTVIELKDNGQVAVNGASHGLPAYEKESFAYRDPKGHVGLGTKYGLMVTCSQKLDVCYIEVNGFYLGKLRGLLGDGNNEPYDDFRLPNGKIVTNEAEFGNAYKMSGSCPAVKTPEHSHHQLHAQLPEACTKVFGASSGLHYLAPLLDIAPFRQACIHAVASNEKNADNEACALARGYTALAVTGLLPAAVPPHCIRCTDGDKPRDILESFEVKVPAKLADIVVYVDTTKDNEVPFKQLVVPLVSQLVDQLKSKKVDDIKVHLVGITSRMPWPIIYDTDNKLKNPKVQFTDEEPVVKCFNTGFEKLDKSICVLVKVLDNVRRTLGLTNEVAGYSSFDDLVLRPGAVKHVINAVGNSDEFPKVPMFQSVKSVAAFIRDRVSVSVIVRTPAIALNGKSVVGFDKENAQVVGEKTSKKASICDNLENVTECRRYIQNLKGQTTTFSSTNYLALDGAQQKSFVQSAVASIVEHMLRQTVSRQCVCAYANPFYGRSVCLNESVKDVVARRK